MKPRITISLFLIVLDSQNTLSINPGHNRLRFGDNWLHFQKQSNLPYLSQTVGIMLPLYFKPASCLIPSLLKLKIKFQENLLIRALETIFGGIDDLFLDSAGDNVTVIPII